MYFYVRFLIYESNIFKEKPDKLLSLTFMNDLKFNDIFDKREKIRTFLEEQYSNQKDKVSLL